MNKLKKYIPLIFLLVITIIFFCSSNKKETYEPVEMLENNEQKLVDEQVKEEKRVKVDIKGAVKNPGVYELSEEQRVINVIDLSGGLLKEADTSKINLSKKLKDEMVIIIATKEKPKEEINDKCECIVKDEKAEENKKDFEANKDEETIKNDAEIDQKDEEVKNDASIDNEPSKPNDETKESKISLNNATKEQLMELPGIGESKALAIIEYRQNNLFKDIEELKNVKGIGQSVYDKIKEYITI